MINTREKIIGMILYSIVIVMMVIIAFKWDMHILESDMPNWLKLLLLEGLK